jgi:7,8-dihydro-6-hydroxymethylpterin dimethyltransferase
LGCQQDTVGLCTKCQKRVASHFVFRDGQVILHKDCPDCGPNESLVSGDAAAWQQKRQIWQYDENACSQCSLKCENCHVDHKPTIVFVDVTNHCNMNCPICIANVRGMGFEFHPPLAYFEKLFKALGQFEPKPLVELFGGEPTLREDLFEIYETAKKYGIKPRIVTNGLKLADEEFCRKVCEREIRIRLAFDGRDGEIYKRLRHIDVADKKLKALQNISKFSRIRSAVLACVARGINDRAVGDLFDLLHEHRHAFDQIGLIPLTENWEAGAFEAEHRTTMEDVEHIVEENVPGGGVEFVPAGMIHCLTLARSFFRKKSRSETLMFGGVHPNCESMTLLISDGQGYRSINTFLRIPFREAVREMYTRARRIEPRLLRLDRTKWLQLWRGRCLIFKTFLPLGLRALDFRKVAKGHPVMAVLRILAGLLGRKKMSALVKQHTDMPKILRVAVLPFEEYHSIDATRLEACKAVFACEDVETGQIKTIPACTWYLYRNDLLKKISEKYGKAKRGSRETELVEA